MFDRIPSVVVWWSIPVLSRFPPLKAAYKKCFPAFSKSVWTENFAQKELWKFLLTFLCARRKLNKSHFQHDAVRLASTNEHSCISGKLGPHILHLHQPGRFWVNVPSLRLMLHRTKDSVNSELADAGTHCELCEACLLLDIL